MPAILTVAGITLLGSFICSLLEAVLYTVTPSQVELLRKRQVFGADLLARLRTDMQEPIAAILTINTITHTVGAAWCGALVGHNYGDFALGIFAAVFTLAILFVTEIVPKSLGVTYAYQMAPWIAWPIQVQIWLIWPVVKISALVMALFTQKDENLFPTEEEIMAMTRLAMKGGELRPQELAWVENSLRLDQVKAADLMTPRTVVYSLPADLPIEDVKERSRHWVHSRLPLTEDQDPDQIVGMVHRRDVFDAFVRPKPAVKTLRDIKRDLEFVPESMRGHQLLDKFIKEKRHMVGVISEYGGFEGVVTLEDVLECLLGDEIVDEHDRHADLQKVARERAKARAKELARIRAEERMLTKDASQDPSTDGETSSEETAPTNDQSLAISDADSGPKPSQPSDEPGPPSSNNNP
ncbi:Hemolysin C [Planctomycetes bacterium Pan216]|uniref:Hemolysin C n=1 Tax=Kolteria novifilia TaxID=2527975 RepID=A0A518AWT0_9BACT|nr:Hemolysin C [Planctomycetes bacterium Pan216]